MADNEQVTPKMIVEHVERLYRDGVLQNIASQLPPDRDGFRIVPTSCSYNLSIAVGPVDMHYGIIVHGQSKYCVLYPNGIFTKTYKTFGWAYKRLKRDMLEAYGGGQS